MTAFSVGDLLVQPASSSLNPSLQLGEQLRLATESAFGQTSRMSGGGSLRTPANSLGGGSGTGTGSLDLTGAGRLSNRPADGGASSNTGPAHGTLERELIRLITQ